MPPNPEVLTVRLVLEATMTIGVILTPGSSPFLTELVNITTTVELRYNVIEGTE
jgi:hypothetical protein